MTVARRMASALTTLIIAVPAWLVASAIAAQPVHASRAGTLFLTTVPAMSGVLFDIQGTFVTTGPGGAATVALGNINGVASNVTLGSNAGPGGSWVRIDRIVPGAHVPHESHLTVGLDVRSPVRLVVLKANSHIPPSHVSRMNLHGLNGDRLSVDPRSAGILHLMSRKIHYAHGALVAQPVTWAVEGVQADPGIAVTTSQPRFDPYNHRRWFIKLAPVAGTVRIRTVPSTPNVQFDLDGTTMTTGPAGFAVGQVANLNNVSGGLALASSSAGQYQVSALRVSRVRSLVPHVRQLIAAIDVRRSVTLRFIDAHGNPVPASAIDDVTMSAGSGEMTTLVGTEVSAPALLLARVPEHIGTDWGTRSVTYSLASVHINGANAVFSGIQHLQAMNSAVWTIRLAVFRLTLTIRDALFGSEIGTRTVITRPDHSEHTVLISDRGPRVIAGMVRGLYTLRIDAAVLGGSTSILVSRDDSINLKVITLLDTVVIAVGGAILLPAAVLLGLFVTRRSRERSTKSERQ